MASPTPTLTCEKCQGVMSATTVPKHGSGLQVFGHVLWISATLLLLLVISVGVLSTGRVATGPGATSDVAAAATGITAVASGCMFLVACAFGIPLFIVGLLLVGSRKVWKCGKCGYVFDRG